MVKPVILVILIFITADVCGYKRAGQGNSLPKDIKILAVPIFQNSSLKYRVEGRFTNAVIEEILKRARALKVTTTTEDADATLTGDIRAFRARGTILDQQGRTRVWNVRIIISVTVRDNLRRKILYQNPRLTFESEYELSDDPDSFFNEENAAVDRIAKDFAQTIVSTIMEGK
ncbi:MAG: LPS assembly lipoprotein LptE [Acidobacteriota bacterium]